ncbi:hypothetical protein VTK56DRAFT_4325 [Thermocarpiscus australiensis]
MTFDFTSKRDRSQLLRDLVPKLMGQSAFHQPANQPRRIHHNPPGQGTSRWAAARRARREQKDKQKEEGGGGNDNGNGDTEMTDQVAN